MTRPFAGLCAALALAACTALPSQASTAARDAELYEAAISRAEADSDARCIAAGFNDQTSCLRARYEALRLARQPLPR